MRRQEAYLVMGRISQTKGVNEVFFVRTSALQYTQTAE